MTFPIYGKLKMFQTTNQNMFNSIAMLVYQRVIPVVLTYLLGWATKWSHIPKTTHCSPGSSCNWGAHPPRWHRCAPPKSRPLAQENSGGIPRTSLIKLYDALWNLRWYLENIFLEDQSGFLVPFRDDPINVNGIYRHRPSVVPMEKMGSSQHGVDHMDYRDWCERIFPIFEKSPWKKGSRPVFGQIHFGQMFRVWLLGSSSPLLSLEVIFQPASHGTWYW